MFLLINSENQWKYFHILSSMHRLRKRIFKDQCGWPVDVINGMEFDQFDTKDAHYIVHVNEQGEVDATTRLIETTKPYLLKDVFHELVESRNMPEDSSIWETTRFCVDTEITCSKMTGKLAAAMLEFALVKGIKEYVSVSDIRIETIIKRFGWSPTRLGKVIHTGTEFCAGESFIVSPLTYKKVCARSAIPQSEAVITNLHEIMIPQLIEGVA